MTAIALPQDAVTLKDGHPVTTSLRVAEIFGKDHAKVLRAIREIVSQVTEKFSQANFGWAEYIDEQGKARPMYELTRDGFTLLVMGFNGREAMAFKLAYIERFNAMEAELTGRLNFAMTVPSRLTLAEYHETRDGLAALQEELDRLFSAFQRVRIECTPDEIEDLSSRRIKVGKKTHLERDLIGKLEEYGVPRQVAKELTGHNDNAVRQFAYKARHNIS